MAVSIDKKFKFVSPGVFIDEIDNSQRPATADAMGPVIIGRAERGPAMKPVELSSFSDFVEIFGNPIAGGQGGDVFRDGNFTSPTYGSYAAQAWLKNSNKVTYVRLLGDQHEDATAGYAGWKLGSASTYSLFLINSGTSGVTGTLAANVYCKAGYSFSLSGTLFGQTGTTAATSSLISGDASSNFVGVVYNGAQEYYRANFNFNEDSDLYIRKVFNTNPTLTTSQISVAVSPYFLGETYEENVKNIVTSSNPLGVVFLDNGTVDGGDFVKPSQKAKTGWVFAQDLSSNWSAYDPNNMRKLFRLEDLGSGESNQRQFKISIQDIKPSSNKFDLYGTFTVAVRLAKDSDASPKIVEIFSNCTLNPNSESYIAKKIGDQYLDWSDTEKRYTLKGNYPNNSKFFRVIMNPNIDAGMVEAACLPFGCFLPPKVSTFTKSDNLAFSGTLVSGSTMSGSPNGPITFTYPSFVLRSASNKGNLGNPKSAYWGALYNKQASYSSADKSFIDLSRVLPGVLDDSSNLVTLDAFSLDDITSISASSAINYSALSVSNTVYYISGSRGAGKSFTGLFSRGDSNVGSSAQSVLNTGWNRFNVPLYGGFDGLDVTESEPFNNLDMTNATETTNYAYYSVAKALNMVQDPERIEMNLIAMPGITNAGLNDQMITLCEARADAMAVVDLPDVYTPRSEGTNYGLGTGGAFGNGNSNLDQVVADLKDRGLNSSYAATYFPWVRIKDSINNATLWAPPSIIALGAYSSTDKKSEPWFAPAGFTRGGLSEGAAGIPVVQVSEQLVTKQRDKLYEANINPIAQFPAEGIVIYGAKTLQVTPSALDRINVRRLMIFVEKEISRISRRLLFDPNTKVTWNRFLGQVNPLLQSIQTRFGLSEFKVVLDSTTSTPDLIDQNILYAKIFLKPTRAIEFIALEFNIQPSGASFANL